MPCCEAPKDLIQQLPFLAQLVDLRAKPGADFFGSKRWLEVLIIYLCVYKYMYIYIYRDIDIYLSNLIVIFIVD